LRETGWCMPQGNIELMTTKRFSTSSRRRDLNRLTTNIPSRWRIASIASEDALILPHRANPCGCDFWERQESSGSRRSTHWRRRTTFGIQDGC
jgi:hypothetical protein